MKPLLASILVPRRSGAVVQRFGAAIVSVALAAAVALLLRRYNLPHPFISFSFAAIAIAFWYAGTGPGLLAVVLSCSTLSFVYTPVKVGNLPWDSYLVIYGVFGFFVSWFSSSRIRAERLLSEARDALEIRVAERTAELTMANQTLQRAQEELSDLTQKLAQENLYLEDEIRSDANFKEIVGKSRELRRVLKLVETVAPTDSTALIYGETGTGKELIARSIHNLSSRRSRTFIRLNCAAIPTGLLESELFGHEKGAFTGAFAQRIGRLELANNGTLFLDEIGDLPLELQPKLLRVLQEREFERLGSTRTLSTNVRLIAATNRNLSAMVEEGKFRADLFFRLNVFPVDLPPLRDRRDGQGDVAARFLHHAVLRRAWHDHPAADLVRARPRSHPCRLHLGEPVRDRRAVTLRDAAGAARESPAGHQPRADQRVLTGAGSDRRAIGANPGRHSRSGVHSLRGAGGAQHVPDDAERRGNPARHPDSQAAWASRSGSRPRQ